MRRSAFAVRFSSTASCPATEASQFRLLILKTCLAIGVAFIGGILLAGPMHDLVRREVDIESCNVNDATEPIADHLKIALDIAISFSGRRMATPDPARS